MSIAEACIHGSNYAFLFVMRAPVSEKLRSVLPDTTGTVAYFEDEYRIENFDI